MAFLRTYPRSVSDGFLAGVLVVAIVVSVVVGQVTTAQTDQWQVLATPFLAIAIVDLVRRVIVAVRPSWRSAADA